MDTLVFVGLVVIIAADLVFRIATMKRQDIASRRIDRLIERVSVLELRERMLAEELKRHRKPFVEIGK